MTTHKRQFNEHLHSFQVTFKKSLANKSLTTNQITKILMGEVAATTEVQAEVVVVSKDAEVEVAVAEEEISKVVEAAMVEVKKTARLITSIKKAIKTFLEAATKVTAENNI